MGSQRHRPDWACMCLYRHVEKQWNMWKLKDTRGDIESTNIWGTALKFSFAVLQITTNGASIHIYYLTVSVEESGDDLAQSSV